MLSLGQSRAASTLETEAIFGSTVMIAKVLGTAAVAALASLGAAAPAFADPASFSGISCSCQPTLQQLIPFLQNPPAPFLDNPIDQGIRHGLSDTEPGAIQH
jgi:hypothetical protein